MDVIGVNDWYIVYHIEKRSQHWLLQIAANPRHNIDNSVTEICSGVIQFNFVLNKAMGIDKCI